ncbi:MAG: cell wall-active antibiotics response protein [Rikenellaceae bacterium]|nr:cell wall-active antibiotics response protein [Rikenellaceae bacterium]MCL2693004.1 cell wall-active antibiotics response protein [Rikenellaceae bacterium]
MDTLENKNTCCRNGGLIGIASILILAGFAIFAHKQGWLGGRLYDILISWQMLLIVLGAWALALRNWWSGILLTGVGAFFLIPVLTDAAPGWARTYWPLLLVLVGLLIIVGLLRRRSWIMRFELCGDAKTATHNTGEGFVNSEVSMGEVNHIVLDPVFTGARLRNSLGSTTLDLRHTALAEGETYIDIDCNLGAVELFLPYDWIVETLVSTMLASIEDKRILRSNGTPDVSRKLVLRGRVSLGSIEIKN